MAYASVSKITLTSALIVSALGLLWAAVHVMPLDTLGTIERET